MRRKPRYDLRLTMTWSVTLAFIASFAFASVAGASATIVSPVQDSTIVESNSITYVFDTGVAQPSGSLWYIRFSSSPQVGPEGLLAKRDLGDGAKYGDDMASTAWGKTPTQLGLGLGVPDAPGVVYWQPYESVYHDTAPARGLTLDP